MAPVPWTLLLNTVQHGEVISKFTSKKNRRLRPRPRSKQAGVLSSERKSCDLFSGSPCWPGPTSTCGDPSCWPPHLWLQGLPTRCAAPWRTVPHGDGGGQRTAGGAGPTHACTPQEGQPLGSGPVPCIPAAAGAWAGGWGRSQAQAGAGREGDREGFRCLVSVNEYLWDQSGDVCRGPTRATHTHDFFSSKSCGSP